jgi:hypothetical protein
VAALTAAEPVVKPRPVRGLAFLEAVRNLLHASAVIAYGARRSMPHDARARMPNTTRPQGKPQHHAPGTSSHDPRPRHVRGFVVFRFHCCALAVTGVTVALCCCATVTGVTLRDARAKAQEARSSIANRIRTYRQPEGPSQGARAVLETKRPSKRWALMKTGCADCRAYLAEKFTTSYPLAG